MQMSKPKRLRVEDIEFVEINIVPDPMKVKQAARIYGLAALELAKKKANEAAQDPKAG
jgi:hypothetical protein